jgi:4,5-dihydroxyphthalate decarboxylase
MHPPGLNVRAAPSGRSLSDLLATGEIDALIGAIVPDSLTESASVARMFPDFHALEREYFRTTGIFPIMHALVIRDEVAKAHPWLAARVVDACGAAKEKALAGLRFSGSLRYMLPWLRESVEEVNDVFGGDAWPYGVEGNRAALSAFNRYLCDDGYLSEPLDLDRLFAV